jgi:hypothetical protein
LDPALTFVPLAFLVLLCCGAETAFGVAIIIATFVAASSLATTFSTVNPLGLAVTLVVMLASLLLLPAGTGPYFSFRNADYLLLDDSNPINAEEVASVVAFLERGKLLGVEDSEPLVGEHAPEAGKKEGKAHYTLMEACRSLDFWLFFAIFMLGVGAGICIVNNLPEIVISRLPLAMSNKTYTTKELPHTKDQSTLLALVGIKPYPASASASASSALSPPAGFLRAPCALAHWLALRLPINSLASSTRLGAC